MSTLQLTILQTIIFCNYILYIVKNYGVLPSVSESFYAQQQERKGFIFTLFCYGIGIPMIFQSNETSILFFASGAGLCLVGVASSFKWSGAFTDKLHGIGAAVGILNALVGLGYEYNNWFPLATFILASALIAAFKIKNHIWWIEMSAFLCIIAGLAYRFNS